MSTATGTHLPDLTFVDRDGTTVALRAFAGRPVLLIFLRHLA